MGIWDEYKELFKELAKTAKEEVKYQKHIRTRKADNAEEKEPVQKNAYHTPPKEREEVSKTKSQGYTGTNTPVKKQPAEVKPKTVEKKEAVEVKPNTSANTTNPNNVRSERPSSTQVQVSNRSDESQTQKRSQPVDNQPKSNTNIQESDDNVWNNKNKTVLLILIFFLGWLGGHKFYTGNWVWVLIYLSLCTTGASLTFSAIEYLHVICMTKKSFDRKYNKRRIKPYTFTW